MARDLDAGKGKSTIYRHQQGLDAKTLPLCPDWQPGIISPLDPSGKHRIIGKELAGAPQTHQQIGQVSFPPGRFRCCRQYLSCGFRP